MRVGEIMTTSVVTVQPDVSVEDAVRLMLERRISGLPVVDRDGRLTGILTEGDLLRRAELGTEHRRPRWIAFLLGSGTLADEYTHTHGRTVAELMTIDVETAQEDAPLEAVVDRMVARHIKRLPVISGGKVVGIVSRSDLLRALRLEIAAEPRPTGADPEIRRRILDGMAAQSWAPTALVNVQVVGSKVFLSGSLTDERQRNALRVLAENVPGVREVEDHLVYVDPYSGWVIEPDAEPEMHGKTAV
jgi:CBS domain-containing protein